MRFGIFIRAVRIHRLIRKNSKLFWELILICKTSPNIFFLQVRFGAECMGQEWFADQLHKSQLEDFS